jgi:hypothetical protein
MYVCMYVCMYLCMYTLYMDYILAVPCYAITFMYL